MAYEISADWVKNTEDNHPPFLGAESNHDDFRNWEKVVQDVLSCILNIKEGIRVALVCADQPDCDVLRYACRTFIEDCFTNFGGHSVYKKNAHQSESYFINSCLFVSITAEKSTDIYDEVYNTFRELLTHRCPKYKINKNKTLTEMEKDFNKKVESFKNDILGKLETRSLIYKYIPTKEEAEKEQKANEKVLKVSLDKMEESILNVIKKFKSIYGAPKVIFFLISLPMEEYKHIKNETVLFPGFVKLALKCETLPYEKNKTKDIEQKESTLYNNAADNEITTKNLDIEKNDNETEKKVVDSMQENLYSNPNSAQSTGKEQYKEQF